MKETPQAKQFRESLPPELQGMTSVTMSYQKYLRIINGHLQTLFGTAADWNHCLDRYYKSNEYVKSCRFITSCDEIPELTRADLDAMLAEEQNYSDKVSELKRNSRMILTDNLPSTNKDELLLQNIAILGLSLEHNKETIFNWLIDRSRISKEIDVNWMRERHQPLLGIIENIMSALFEDGLLLEFPAIGSVMTQQKSKYYYRGENAFYGTSKPSVFRNSINPITRIMRLYECWNLLDKFEAVNRWGYCAVNYMALAQHYGLHTQMMDITSDLRTALFFMCCKYGDDNRWHPLTNADFSERNSRSNVAHIGGDSRYGIFYRSLTEITDMKWAMSDDNVGFNIITPVGYQPFMRCSQQHAYMLMVDDDKYDMYKDPHFEKFKIRLDEELCNWIYEEMDGGNSIYPNNDLPDISPYIQKINSSNCFSESVYKTTVAGLGFDKSGLAKVDVYMDRLGLKVCPDICHIPQFELQRINQHYSIDTAYKRIQAIPKMKPMLTLPSDTKIELLK